MADIMDTSATAVISDVHIGAGVLDDCDPALEAGLVDFLRFLGAYRRPVELVVNGDFLDFAQAPPIDGQELQGTSATGVPLCFTAAQSVEKFAAIHMAHRPVFDAMAEFLGRNPGHHLVILPGNHDADYFFEPVRERFVATFPEAVRSQLRFHLEQVYRPEHAPGLWIEHGHQHDPCNRFRIADVPRWSEKDPPILPDKTGTPRLIECVGTRLMTRYLNRLDGLYPFVDNVKPLSRFLWLFGASLWTGRHGPLKASVAVWWMIRYVGQTAWGDTRRDLLSIESGGPDDPDWFPPASEFVRGLARAIPDHGDRLLDDLDARGFAADRPLAHYADSEAAAELLLAALADNLDVLDREDAHRESVLGVELPGTLSLAQAFFHDESAALRRVADRIAADEPVDGIVMGHTHEFVDATLARAVHYVNIGSWTRYLAKSDPLMTWDILRRGQDAHFPYRLVYAWYDPAASPRLDVRTFRKDETYGSW